LVDESKIEDVSDSCDFASAIQACIVDLETAIDAKTNDGKSEEGQGATLDSQSCSNSSFQPGNNISPEGQYLPDGEMWFSEPLVD